MQETLWFQEPRSSRKSSGENAYTLVIAPTVATPTPVGTNVTVNVANSDWMVPGENVIIGGVLGHRNIPSCVNSSDIHNRTIEIPRIPE